MIRGGVNNVLLWSIARNRLEVGVGIGMELGLGKDLGDVRKLSRRNLWTIKIRFREVRKTKHQLAQLSIKIWKLS